MNRQLLLAALSIAAHWQAAFAADIDVQPTYQLGDKMVATFTVPPLANSEPIYEWSASEGIGFEPVGDNRTLHFWTKQGGRLDLKATYTLNYLAPDPADPTKGVPSKLTLPPYYHHAEFTVEGEPGPAPVKTLAQLAGKDAKDIGSRLVAISRAVTAGGITFEKFPAVLSGSLAPWKDNPALPVITAKLGKLADLKAIVTELDLMVAELGSLPPPDVIVDGKRHVVVIHEADDDTPAQGLLWVRLQDGSNYFTEKGHAVNVWDDDSVDGSNQPIPLVESLEALGLPEPAIFVLDPTTKAVIGKQSLPKDATEATVVDFVKANGG